MSAKGWKTILLGDISQFRYGKMPDKRLVTSEDDYPVFSGYQINGYYPKYNCEEDKLIVVARGVGGTGDVKITKEKCWLTNLSIEFLLNDDKASVPFLYYYFLKDTLRHLDSGSAQSQITIDDLKRIYIELPDLPTQTRIAAILSALDDKIELNRQTNATLEAIAQAIFKEWFVDFRFPGATDEMQDSELGTIPKGWWVGKIGDICELNPRLTLRKGAISKYVEMKNLSQCSLSIEEPREREFASGSKFQNGDTLFARITPCLENGKTGFVDFLDDLEIGWGSTEFIVLRGRNFINPYFVYCLSRLSNFREFAIQSMIGSSGRQRVVESILSDYPTIIPDQETVDNFFEVVEKLFFQVKNNSDQSATVAKIRNALLPKLMSGEIEV